MLSIIGTPIGNLEDISLRAVRELATSDIILTEDTRSFDTLWRSIVDQCGLHDIQISQKPMIVSYYKEVEFQKLPDVIEWISLGKRVALVSEAGMPIISDPGHLLLSTVIKRKLPYTVIPGPTALDTAIVGCGLKHQSVLFVGFLPKRTADLTKLLHTLHTTSESLDDVLYVAYESPERIKDTCTLIASLYPTARQVICRELTKRYEEYVPVTPELDWSSVRGEIVLTMVF